MSQKRVEFLPFKTSTLNQIYRERYLDWIESGDAILKKTRFHKEAYRKKICSTCSEEQQKKRKCVKYTIDGKELQSCGHLDSACAQKFKKEFDEHMTFHPALNRMKIIQESEKIQLKIPKLESIQLNPFKIITK
jgi:hypothetical protein